MWLGILEANSAIIFVNVIIYKKEKNTFANFSDNWKFNSVSSPELLLSSSIFPWHFVVLLNSNTHA